MKLASGATLELSLDDAIVVMKICSDLVVPQYSSRQRPIKKYGNKEV